MKRPSFQFYPADWRNDAGLKLCSLSARGLWIEMICIMHAADPYGHLCAAGRPLDSKDLSKFVGESERDVRRWLDELARNNVCSLEEGAFISRRMVRDEALRERRATGGEAGSEYGHLGAEHGKKGGRPRKLRGVSYPPLEPPPSSSSSSSSSSSNTIKGGGELFDRFWAAYPRKTAKDSARKAFENRKPDEALLTAMLAAIAVQAKSTEWMKNGGQFIPHPATWLNAGRWLDEPATATESAAKRGTDEYAAIHKTADWWRDAGFESVWDADASKCWHDNAHQFREGKRAEVTQ